MSVTNTCISIHYHALHTSFDSLSSIVERIYVQRMPFFDLTARLINRWSIT